MGLAVCCSSFTQAGTNATTPIHTDECAPTAKRMGGVENWWWAV